MGIGHATEMVVALLLGMLVLGASLAGLLGLGGIDTGGWRDAAPALMLLGTALPMTVPMVARMFHRGDGVRAAWEMTGARTYAEGKQGWIEAGPPVGSGAVAPV
jgi:hypothetical protein